MGQAENGNRRPRAIVHRRVLDVAEANPDASPSAIADRVSGATADLVADVLDEYGDPASASSPASGSSGTDEESTTETQAGDDTADAAPPEQPANTDTAAESTASSDRQMTANDTDQTDASDSKRNGEHDPDPDPGVDLTEKQQRALRHVRENPAASQADIATELDVTRATVSRWLNDIPGFEWSDRGTFADAVFDDASDGTDDASEVTDDGTDGTEDVGTETDTVATGSDDGGDGVDTSGARSGDVTTTVDIAPDLAHRVVHACMQSDRITEDEELELLAAFMNDSR